MGTAKVKEQRGRQIQAAKTPKKKRGEARGGKGGTSVFLDGAQTIRKKENTKKGPEGVLKAAKTEGDGRVRECRFLSGRGGGKVRRESGS